MNAPESQYQRLLRAAQELNLQSPRWDLYSELKRAYHEEFLAVPPAKYEADMRAIARVCGV